MKRQFLIIIGVFLLAILACTNSERVAIEQYSATATADAATTEAGYITAEAKDAKEATAEAIDIATIVADNATAEAEDATATAQTFVTATDTPEPGTSPITGTIGTPPPPIDVTPTCTGTQHTLPITATVQFPIPPNANLQQAEDGSISMNFPVENQSEFDNWLEFINENYLNLSSNTSYSTDSSGKNFDWRIGLLFPPNTQMTELADGQTEFLYSPVPPEDIPADGTAVTLPSVIEMPLPPEGTEPQYLDDGQVTINFSVNDKAEFDKWVQFMTDNHILGGTSYDDPFTSGELGFNFPAGTTIEITDTAWIITKPQ